MQWRTAVELAARYDVPLLEVDTAEMDDPLYRANGGDRCYHCKRELWSRLGAIARERRHRVPYTAWARVDGDCEVLETDENNNLATLPGGLTITGT